MHFNWCKACFSLRYPDILHGSLTVIDPNVLLFRLLQVENRYRQSKSLQCRYASFSVLLFLSNGNHSR